MTAVYLGLGSNLDDRAGHLAFGLRELRAHGRLTGVSAVYESEPVGYTDQPRFLNLVARLETGLAPAALLDAVLGIERRRGRTRAFRNAPRTLDIDILAVDPEGDAQSRWDAARSETPRAGAGVAARVIREEGLTVPHPRMVERAFVLVPLLELAPRLTDPASGRPFASALDTLLRQRGRTPEDAVEGDVGSLPEAALEALGLRRIMDGRTLLEESDESNDARHPDGDDDVDGA